MTTASDRLIFALDVPTADEAMTLVDQLQGVVGCFKVGLELFIAAGPPLVKTIAGRADVFLDLKLHDIPATVGRAAGVAANLGVRYLTVHADPGGRSLKAAVEATRGRVSVLAITVLTSHRAEDYGFMDSAALADLVDSRATMARGCGSAGVVCSGQEAARVRLLCGPGFEIITPGIRLAAGAHGDQSRVMTPAAAIAAGADKIVVGRPIRDAEDPREAAQRILAEL